MCSGYAVTHLALDSNAPSSPVTSRTISVNDFWAALPQGFRIDVKYYIPFQDEENQVLLAHLVLYGAFNATYELSSWPEEPLNIRGIDNKHRFEQASGAYIFRPKDNTPDSLVTLNVDGDVEELTGSNFKEWRVNLEDGWAAYSVRQFDENPNDLEVEWIVGPIPGKNFLL
jgi:hypothetical protein